MLKRINREVVKPVPLLGGADTRPIKGANLFPEVYSNIFLCAKKKSGKSSVVYKIIKDCSGRDTKVLAFFSTIHKDNVWLQIAALCKKKGIYFEGHTSLKEEGIDILDQFLQMEAAPPVVEEPKAKQKLVLFDDDEDEADKPNKTKYLAPKWIIVLDDLSTELKSKSVESILKKNRHLRAKIIISSQYLNDLKPESRKQMDYFLVFKGQNKEKLETIHRDADVGISYDELSDLYHTATEQPYSFLYIDTRNDSFRKGFSHEFSV